MAIKADDWFRALMTTNDESPMFGPTVQMLAQSHGVAEDYVKALVRDEKQREAGMATAVEATPGDLLSEEWAAFLTPAESADDPDFRTRHVGITNAKG